MRRLELREEALNLRYEPATDLSDVVKGTAPVFMRDPVEFFSRTHLTPSMKEIVVKALMNVLGLREAKVGGKKYTVSSNLILLPSDLGGGKTHTLILLYHVFKIIGEARGREEVVQKISVLDRDIAEFISERWSVIEKTRPRVVVVDCKDSELAPGRLKPITIGGKSIKTLWGYIGYELGRYDIVKNFDEEVTTPYADVIHSLLNESGALVLIDEIGRYYDVSGIEPTKISAFLMNLAEAVSKYTTSQVAVVISVPYDIQAGTVEAKTSMKYIHRPELVEAVSAVLNRVKAEIIRPVGTGDLVAILRKRIFKLSEDEFKKLYSDYVAREYKKERPRKVKAVLEDKGFWRKLESTYPFHPMFIETLEKLAYMLPHLQRTRDAIRIAVQAVIALREGAFDFVEDGEVELVMPYHIPVFIAEALDETILRGATSDYVAFKVVLHSNVARPISIDSIKKLTKEEFFSSVVPEGIRGLADDARKLVFKLASVIWLYSLMGKGLPSNLGMYPTTLDLVYSVSPTDKDVTVALEKLRLVLPQLMVYGDPDSDAAKWFFSNVPTLEELIQEYKKNVTDQMAIDALTRILKDYLEGKKKGPGRPPKVKIEPEVLAGGLSVRSIHEIPSEVLSSRDPYVLVFTTKVSKQELKEVLRGRNNIVVLAPYVEGVDEPAKLSPEDIAGVKELTGLTNITAWDALIEMLRYLAAVESISEETLASFVSKNIQGLSDDYLRSVVELLRARHRDRVEYYRRQVWTMLAKCYRRVYYYRLGEIKYFDGLALEHEKSILAIVERFLKDKGFIPLEFTGGDLLSIVRDYLGMDIKATPLNVGNVWQLLLTTEKANVPLVSYEMFVEAVKDLIRSMDYIVKVKGELLWKSIFNSLEAARSADEGAALVNMVVGALRAYNTSWDDVELIYWENAFDEWFKKFLSGVPTDKVAKLLDASGNVIDVRDIKIDVRNTVRSGKLFYEVKKYPVELVHNLPSDLMENSEYTCEMTVNVKDYDGEVKVVLKPDEGIVTEPPEFTGKPPLQVKFNVKTGKPGRYSIRVEVRGDAGILDVRAIDFLVKGEWIEVEVEATEAEREATEGVKLVVAVATTIPSADSVIRMASAYLGRLRLSTTVVASGAEISLGMNLTIDKNNVNILRALWSSVTSLIKAVTSEPSTLNIEYMPATEPELRDVLKYIVEPKGLKLKIKKKAI